MAGFWDYVAEQDKGRKASPEEEAEAQMSALQRQNNRLVREQEAEDGTFWNDRWQDVKSGVGTVIGDTAAGIDYLTAGKMGLTQKARGVVDSLQDSANEGYSLHHNDEMARSEQEYEEARANGDSEIMAALKSMNWEKAASGATQSLPSMAAAIVPGTVGAKAAIKGAQALQKGFRAMGMSESAAKAATVRAIRASGAFAGSATQSGTDLAYNAINYNADHGRDFYEGAGDVLAGGLTTGAIDALSAGVAGVSPQDLVYGRMARNAVKGGEQAAIGGATKEGMLRRLGAGIGVAGKDILAEGGTEAVQSWQEQGHQNRIEGKDWDDGAMRAAIEGGVTGALMGSAGAGWHGAKRVFRPNQKADLLNGGSEETSNTPKQEEFNFQTPASDRGVWKDGDSQGYLDLGDPLPADGSVPEGTQGPQYRPKIRPDTPANTNQTPGKTVAESAPAVPHVPDMRTPDMFGGDGNPEATSDFDDVWGDRMGAPADVGGQKAYAAAKETYEGMTDDEKDVARAFAMGAKAAGVRGPKQVSDILTTLSNGFKGFNKDRAAAEVRDAIGEALDTFTKAKGMKAKAAAKAELRRLVATHGALMGVEDLNATLAALDDPRFAAGERDHTKLLAEQERLQNKFDNEGGYKGSPAMAARDSQRLNEIAGLLQDADDRRNGVLFPGYQQESGFINGGEVEEGGSFLAPTEDGDLGESFGTPAAPEGDTLGGEQAGPGARTGSTGAAINGGTPSGKPTGVTIGEGPANGTTDITEGNKNDKKEPAAKPAEKQSAGKSDTKPTKGSSAAKPVPEQGARKRTGGNKVNGKRNAGGDQRPTSKPQKPDSGSNGEKPNADEGSGVRKEKPEVKQPEQKKKTKQQEFDERQGELDFNAPSEPDTEDRPGKWTEGDPQGKLDLNDDPDGELPTEESPEQEEPEAPEDDGRQEKLDLPFSPESAFGFLDREPLDKRGFVKFFTDSSPLAKEIGRALQAPEKVFKALEKGTYKLPAAITQDIDAREKSGEYDHDQAQLARIMARHAIMRALWFYTPSGGELRGRFITETSAAFNEFDDYVSDHGVSQHKADAVYFSDAYGLPITNNSAAAAEALRKATVGDGMSIKDAIKLAKAYAKKAAAKEKKASSKPAPKKAPAAPRKTRAEKVRELQTTNRSTGKPYPDYVQKAIDDAIDKLRKTFGAAIIDKMLDSGFLSVVSDATEVGGSSYAGGFYSPATRCVVVVAQTGGLDPVNVLAHEMGVHAASRPEMAPLYAQAKKLMDDAIVRMRHDPHWGVGMSAPLADRVMRKAANHWSSSIGNYTNPGTHPEECFAYIAGWAVQMGMQPDYTTPLGRLLKRFASAIEKVMQSLLGKQAPALTVQDIATIAHANMERFASGKMSPATLAPAIDKRRPGRYNKTELANIDRAGDLVQEWAHELHEAFVAPTAAKEKLHKAKAAAIETRLQNARIFVPVKTTIGTAALSLPVISSRAAPGNFVVAYPQAQENAEKFIAQINREIEKEDPLVTAVVKKQDAEAKKEEKKSFEERAKELGIPDPEVTELPKEVFKAKSIPQAIDHFLTHRAQQAVQRYGGPFKPIAMAVLNAMHAATSKFFPGLMFTESLVGAVEKVMPSVRKWYDALLEKKEIVNRIALTANEVHNIWRGMEDTDVAQANKFLATATLSGVWWDESKKPEGLDKDQWAAYKASIPKDETELAKHNEDVKALKAEYDKLSNQAKKAVEAVFAANAKLKQDEVAAHRKYIVRNYIPTVLDRMTRLMTTPTEGHPIADEIVKAARTWRAEMNAKKGAEAKYKYYTETVIPALRTLEDKVLVSERELPKAYAKAFSKMLDERKAIEDHKNALRNLVSQMYSPYAKLSRKGDHFIVGRSKELIKLINQKNTLAKLHRESPEKWTKKHQELLRDINKKIEEMKGDGKHYWFSAVDGGPAAGAKVDELRKEHKDMVFEEPFPVDADLSSPKASWEALEKLVMTAGLDIDMGEFSTTGEAASLSALRDTGRKLIIQSLLQDAVQKSDLKRMKVKGHDENMFRAFMDNAHQSAWRIASISTFADSTDALSAMIQEKKSAPDADRPFLGAVMNEIVKRHSLMANPPKNDWVGPTQRKVSEYMLFTSPAYYLQNATQPFIMSVPFMAGKFGNATQTAGMVVKYYKAISKDMWNKRKSGWSIDSLADLKDENGERLISDDDIAMLKKLQRDGLIDFGMTSEFGELGEPGKGKISREYHKISEAIFNFNQRLEMTNRISTALVAYKLAKDKPAKVAGLGINSLGYEDAKTSKERENMDAVAYAHEVIYRTHGDYSSENSPRFFMAGGLGMGGMEKLMFQFRKYQMIQLGFFGHMMAEAYKGETPEAKREAARAFLYSIGTSLVACGTAGTILFNMAMAAVAGICAADGEDNDDWWMRVLGGGALARGIVYGVPAGLGLDVHDRIGSGEAHKLFPYRQQGKGESTWHSYLGAIAGPVGSMLDRVITGGVQMGTSFGLGLGEEEAHFYAGQFVGGMEKVVPKGFGNFAKALDFYHNGVVSGNRRVMLDAKDVDIIDAALVFTGLPGNKVKQVWEEASKYYEYKDAMASRLTEAKKAYRTGHMKQAVAELKEYNRTAKLAGEKTKSLSDLAKSEKKSKFTYRY